MKSNTMCIMPWLAREVRLDGTLSLCNTTEFQLKESDGTPLLVGALANASEIENNKDLQELKRDLISGKQAKVCWRCWKEEDIGTTSRRQKMNREHAGDLEKILQLPEASFPIKIFDLKVGTTCNQKCLICGPDVSSSWIKEYSDIYGGAGFPITKNITKQSLPLLHEMILAVQVFYFLLY